MPRDFIGARDTAIYMAAMSEVESRLGERGPNITPATVTGIGDWKRENIADYLKALPAIKDKIK